MYEYLATIDRVVDGDTVDLTVDAGFYINLRMRVRVRGVDAPETRGQSRAVGLEAKQFVETELPPDTTVVISTYKIGKFGRYIADIRYIPGVKEAVASEIKEQGVDLAERLITAGYAEPY